MATGYSAPRVCGDDPMAMVDMSDNANVLPAYAGMIPCVKPIEKGEGQCSPRMRG